MDCRMWMLLLAGAAMNARPAAAQEFDSAMEIGTGQLIIVNSDTDGLVGWSFVPRSDMAVSHIGVIDEQRDGLARDHDVALYRRSPRQLLATAVISAGSVAPLIGDSRYESVPFLILEQGVEYYMVSNNWHEELLRFTYAPLGRYVTVHPDVLWMSSMISNTVNETFATYAPDPTLGPGFGPNLRFTTDATDCDENGVIDFIEIAEGTADDCNGNLVLDSCELASGAVFDCNHNGIPDACDLAADPNLDIEGNGLIDTCEECRTDYDVDGSTGVSDFLGILSSWGTCAQPCRPGRPSFGRCAGDSDTDCVIGVADFLAVLAAWGDCP